MCAKRNLVWSGVVTASLSLSPGLAQTPSTPLPRPSEPPASPPAAAPPSSATPSSDAAAATPDELAMCLTQLTKQKVRYKELGRSERGTCSVEGTVEMEAVETAFGSLSFSDKPVFACGFALKLASFVQDIVSPLGRATLSAPVTAISTGPGYVCRKRNNQADGKLSEHAKAAAADVSQFGLSDGKHIEVHADDSGDEPGKLAFIRGVRHAACGYFTTVLGPGSNAEHGNHFHFDLALHGRTANYRICE